MSDMIWWSPKRTYVLRSLVLNGWGDEAIAGQMGTTRRQVYEKRAELKIGPLATAEPPWLVAEKKRDAAADIKMRENDTKMHPKRTIATPPKPKRKTSPVAVGQGRSQTENYIQTTFRMLCAAARDGVRPPTNKEIADRLGLSSIGSTSRFVSVLESRGLISIVRNSCTRQITIVETGKSTPPIAEAKAKHPNSPPAPTRETQSKRAESDPGGVSTTPPGPAAREDLPKPTQAPARAYVNRASEARSSKSRIHANGETVPALEMSRGFNGPPAKLCQWIAGVPTGDNTCKCLDPVEPGKPYCPPHQARTYSKVQVLPVRVQQ